MHGKTPQSGAAARAQEPLASLKNALLPPRPRAVLEAMLSALSGLLETGIAATFHDLEQQLFKLAEQARTNEQQNRCFESMREIKRGRPDVMPHFLLCVESALASVTQPDQTPECSRRNRVAEGELDLVDPGEFEELLALQDAAGRTELKYNQALFLLGQRFGVLVGKKAFEADELPLGPYRLCDCFRRATHGLELQLEYRILMYRAFERSCLTLLGKLLDQANAICVQQRVLPHLTAASMASKRAAEGIAAQKGRAAGAIAEPLPQQEATLREEGYPGAVPFHHPVHAPPPRGIERRLGRPPSEGAPAAPLALGSGMVQPMVGWPTAQAAGPVADDGQDAEIFDTMRDLLSGRRQALGVAAQEIDLNAHAVRTEDVQAVLSTWRDQPPMSVRAGGRTVGRSVAHLKQDLLNQLRQITPENKTPKLSETDNDTIDLVGMLFDHLLKDTRRKSPAQDLVTRLQVPLLRVAIEDKAFITRRSHPARQFLNAVTEASAFWFDDETQDRALADKMRLLVDRVVAGYQGDVAVFGEAHQELAKHLSGLIRKSEVTERRHVDAARGRERLELARTTAQRAIEELLRKHKPPALVKTVLEQAWTDVLSLTLLRQGEASAPYQKRLKVAEQLVTMGRQPDPNSKETQELRQEVTQGLTQVGYHADDLQGVLQRLFADPEPVPEKGAGEETASVTELAIKLKQRARLGEDAEADSPSKPAEQDARPLTIDEQKVLAQLRSVPFGTWFDFQAEAEGEWVRRKLSWFSTLTGRCLFVNQHGLRSDECTLEELARDLVRGRARAVEESKGSLIDRAWAAIMKTLKQFAGELPAPGRPGAGV